MVTNAKSAARRSSWLRRLLVSGIITVGLIYLLLQQIDPEAIIHALSSINPVWALAGLIFYIMNNLLRAVRFMILLPSHPNQIVRMLAVVSGLSLMNQILPARTGELSFIYLASRGEGFDTGESAAALLLARTFDLLTISFLFIVMALANLDHLPADTAIYIYIMASVMSIGGLALVSLPRVGGTLLSTMTQIFQRLGTSQTRLCQRLALIAEQMVGNFAAAHSLSTYSLMSVSSILVWLLNFGIMYAFVRGLGIDLSYPHLIIGATFANLTNVLPISGIGNFGTLEAGWMAGFMLLGFDHQTAITTGFTTHILAFLCALITGLWGLALLRFKHSDQSQPRSRAAEQN